MFEFHKIYRMKIHMINGNFKTIIVNVILFCRLEKIWNRIIADDMYLSLTHPE